MNTILESAFTYEVGLTKRKLKYPKTHITCFDSAVKYIRKFYSKDIGIYESAFILLLNRQNETIGYAKIAQGGISSAVIDIRILAKYCIETLASGCIFAHNHPSGNLDPSEDDRAVTERIKTTLQMFNCTLQDSIILTEQGAHSIIHNHTI